MFSQIGMKDRGHFFKSNELLYLIYLYKFCNVEENNSFLRSKVSAYQNHQKRERVKF